MEYYYFLVFVILGVLLKFLLSTSTRKGMFSFAILVYQLIRFNSDGLRPVGGSRLKTLFARLVLQLGLWTRQQRSVVTEEMVDAKVPGNGSNYNDSFVFLASDAEGKFFITRLGFRGIGSTETWLLIYTPEIGEWKVPTEWLETENGERIRSCGVEYTCLDPGKRWHITYNGPLINPNGEIKQGEVDLIWIAESKRFHSGEHMDLGMLSRSMSEMEWSREYFKRISSENQTRIEQGGRITGTVVVGEERIPCALRSIRDHSWGRRDWNYINRYTWFCISLEDDLVIGGHKFRHIGYATANYGNSFRHTGGLWISGPDCVLPIVSNSNHEFIGEDGKIPKEFAVQFEPKGLPIQIMNITRGFHHSWYMNEGKFEVCESYARVEIGGVEGHGIVEFGYGGHINGYDKIRAMPFRF